MCWTCCARNIPIRRTNAASRRALRNGSGVSYTQWEAWLALYHGKLLVIAKAADSAERGPRYMPTDASRAAQTAHVARLKAMGCYPSTFTSPDNLAKRIGLLPVSWTPRKGVC